MHCDFELFERGIVVNNQARKLCFFLERGRNVHVVGIRDEDVSVLTMY